MSSSEGKTPEGVQRKFSSVAVDAELDAGSSSTPPARQGSHLSTSAPRPHVKRTSCVALDSEASTVSPPSLSTTRPAIQYSPSCLAVGAVLNQGGSSAAPTSSQDTQLSPSPPEPVVQRRSSRVAVDAGKNAGVSPAVPTSTATPISSSASLRGAGRKSKAPANRPQRSFRRGPRKSQTTPSGKQGASIASSQAPSFADSATKGSTPSTSHKSKKLPEHAPSSGALESPITGDALATKAKDTARKEGSNGGTERPPLAPTQNRPTRAVRPRLSRVEPPQSSDQKTRQDSMKAALNELLLDVGTKEPSGSPSTSSRLPRRTEWKWPLDPKVLCIALFCGAIFCVTIFLLPRGRQTKGRCLTMSCVSHRELIERQLDRSVDPCYDFAAYVCGGWAPRKEFSDLSSSALEDMVVAWLSKLPDMLQKSSARLPVGRKAAAMLDSCTTEAGSQIGIIKNFMRERGLFWPEDREHKRRPLQVLFDLSFNWQVYLWFLFKLLPTTGNSDLKRRVLFTHSDRMLYWRALFKRIPKEHFQNVYTNIFKLFVNDTSRSPSPKAIEDAYKTLQYAFANLVRASTWKPPVPAVYSLRELGGLWSASSAKYFEYVFNTTLGTGQSFTMEDLVLFSDVALWDGLRVIFSNTDNRAVLHHLAWLFLFAYAPVASPNAALLILHGSNELAKQERLPFCSRQVESSYTLLVASAAAVALFTEEERHRIEKHLTGVLEMATEMCLAASWLDNQTQHVAAEKLRNMRRVLWPAEMFLKAEVLEEAYANFPDKSPSFAHYWIETRRSWRARLGSVAGLEELRIPKSFSEPYIQYEHVLNQLSLSLGALAPPLYYKDGTKAMLHGGLGYYYAKELIKALDVQGLQVDPKGKIVSSWLSGTVKHRYAARVLGCLTSADSSIFPEVPALEVAYAAFKRHTDENDTQISEELTEEKTFFITACLFSCAKREADNLYGGDCNKAMANFAPFAKAFKCPEGSDMNPKKKCTFFR